MKNDLRKWEMSTRIRRCFKNQLKGRQSRHHAEGEEEAPQDLPPPKIALRRGELSAFASHALSRGRGPNINHKQGETLPYKVNVSIFTMAQLFWWPKLKRGKHELVQKKANGSTRENGKLVLREKTVQFWWKVKYRRRKTIWVKGVKGKILSCQKKKMHQYSYN